MDDHFFARAVGKGIDLQPGRAAVRGDRQLECEQPEGGCDFTQFFVSPGILACFLFGLFVRKAPAAAAIAGMLLNIPVYGLLHLSPPFLESVGLGGKAGWLDWLALQADGTCFLNKMAITFTVIVLVMAIITRLWPLQRPVEMPVREAFDDKPAPLVLWLGVAIDVTVIGLYVLLW